MDEQPTDFWTVVSAAVQPYVPLVIVGGVVLGFLYFAITLYYGRTDKLRDWLK